MEDPGTGGADVENCDAAVCGLDPGLDCECERKWSLGGGGANVMGFRELAEG